MHVVAAEVGAGRAIAQVRGRDGERGGDFEAAIVTDLGQMRAEGADDVGEGGVLQDAQAERARERRGGAGQRLRVEEWIADILQAEEAARASCWE